MMTKVTQAIILKIGRKKHLIEEGKPFNFIWQGHPAFPPETYCNALFKGMYNKDEEERIRLEVDYALAKKDGRAEITFSIENIKEIIKIKKVKDGNSYV